MRALQPADPVFCRLLADIKLARDVEKKISRGDITATAGQLDTVKELAERARKHLLDYLARRW
jgi:hypothetical protein